jgi:uncharacterized peroxidase-related enzyme
MPFIEIIPESEIDDDVRTMYERQQAHYGYVPNYAQVFCYRPEIMRLWAQLQSGIRRYMDKRRFELITFAAASTLRSTLCSLAHGKALTEFLSAKDVQAIAKGESPQSLTPAEAQMISFGRKVARDASSVTSADVAQLKRHGFSDAEVFDIAATAAARAFFSKLIESLGVEAEAPLRSLDQEFKTALAVGRPVDPIESQSLSRAVV